VIVDTSALVAILRNEPDAYSCARAIGQAELARISAANFLETAIVIDSNRSGVPGRDLDQLMQESSIVIEPVTAEHARIAREAYRDFGKGRGHPAQLSFGDCFAYALAKATGEPLLFIGNDFSHTDIEPAI
jgi:ribonuclease VapC